MNQAFASPQVKPVSKSNRFVTFMLHSPFNVFMSGLMLITVKDRKSGRAISMPVNYVRDGETLLVTSKTDRTWWKNVRGGAPITLLINGKTYRADATVIEEQARVEEELLRFFRLTKRTIAGIHLNADGQPTPPEKFERVVQSRVVVMITYLTRL